MARSGRAFPVKPNFGRRQTIDAIYDSATSGPKYPPFGTNDATDGGTAWNQVSQISSVNAIGTYVNSSNYPSSGTNISQYLVSQDYRFNIGPTRSIAGILVELMGCISAYEGGPPFPTPITCRLIRNNVIRVSNRVQTVSATTTSIDYSYGGPLDSWDEPWTPAEINDVNFGVAVRKESNATFIQIVVDAVRITIYTANLVLPVFTYLTGTYNFGPTAVTVGATSLTVYVDVARHTNAAVTMTLTVEISYNNGSTWELFVSGSGPGGSPTVGPSGLNEPRWWLRRNLASVADANTQYRGSLVLSGGSLVTSVGAFVN
ncbi:MAG: hypothetical protein ABI728_01315 [Betaproteobacteria bacterium]